VVGAIAAHGYLHVFGGEDCLCHRLAHCQPHRCLVPRRDSQDLPTLPAVGIFPACDCPTEFRFGPR
jgi:hypothetical protein